MSEFDTTGRVWFRDALSQMDLGSFDHANDLTPKAGARINNTAGLDAALKNIGTLLTPLSGPTRPVRVVAFNKTAEQNWGVPWHQDRVIAVTDKADVPEFTNWSQKAGIWHCEPPLDLLSQILFVRVHLDDCDAQSGAMQISLGSHRLGNVAAIDAAKMAATFPLETCTAKRGDVLVLKMLTLHRSSPAELPSNRRTYRIDYCNAPLPAPLRWTSQHS